MTITRAVTTWAWLVVASVTLFPTVVWSADPILKPRKYHGPIPAKSYSFAFGFLGGATNEEMYNALDNFVTDRSGDANTEDFGVAPTFDLIYTKKMHPQFAFRGKGTLSILTSSSQGYFVSGQPDTSGLAPLINYDRSFDVYLFSIEGSAMYYFQDASVKEFQTYLGAGFSLFLPYAVFDETRANADTGAPVPGSSATDWSADPGIHALLGFLYHLRTTLAVTIEGRVQLAQSKFTLDIPTSAGMQPVTFDVDYTGFVLTVGVAKFF